MRVLLDECVSEQLRHYFKGYDCQTARYAGLLGLENGELLKAAEAAKFDVLLTVDRGFEYQQNLGKRQNRSRYFLREICSFGRPHHADSNLPSASEFPPTWSGSQNR